MQGALLLLINKKNAAYDFQLIQSIFFLIFQLI